MHGNMAVTARMWPRFGPCFVTWTRTTLLLYNRSAQAKLQCIYLSIPLESTLVGAWGPQHHIAPICSTSFFPIRGPESESYLKSIDIFLLLRRSQCRFKKSVTGGSDHRVQRLYTISRIPLK
jgi:hypothetical protein